MDTSYLFLYKVSVNDNSVNVAILSKCRRSDDIIGFIDPAISPNKSKKLTRLIALARNIHGKVWI